MNESGTQKLPFKRKLKEKLKALFLERAGVKERVYISRSVPTGIEETPVILIYSPNETVEVNDQSPKTYDRNLQIKVECICQGNTDDDLDFDLEVMAQRIEDLIEFDDTMGGLVQHTVLTGVEYQTEPDGQSPMGAAILTFDFQYYTTAVPGATLRDFEGINTKWKVGHNDVETTSEEPQIDAEDQQDIDEGEE